MVTGHRPNLSVLQRPNTGDSKIDDYLRSMARVLTEELSSRSFLTTTSNLIETSVKNYGAVGNGVADDTAAIQAATNDLAGKHIYFPKGVYKLSGTGVSLESSIVFEDGTEIDMRECSNNATAFDARGSLGTFYSLTASAALKATTLTISSSDLIASGIVANSHIQVQSTKTMDPGRTNSQEGEILLVKSVDTATGIITLWEPTTFAWDTADTAQLAKVNFKTNISIVGRALIYSDNTITKIHRGIRFLHCLKPELQGPRFKNIDFHGAAIWSCLYPRVDDIDGEDFYTNTTGYLLAIGGCSRDGLYTRITSDRVRHTVTSSNSNGTGLIGIPQRHRVKGFVAVNSQVGSTGSGADTMDTHAAARNIHFEQGVIVNSSGQGINMECAGGSVTDVEIYGCVSNGVGIYNPTRYKGNWKVTNLKVEDCVASGGNPGNALRVDIGSFTTGFNSVEISNLSSEGCAGRVLFVDASSSATIDKLTVTGVTSDTAADGIYVNRVDSVNLMGVNLKLTGANYGIELKDCKYAVVNTGTITAPVSVSGGGAIFINATSAGDSKKIIIDNIFVKAETPVLFYGVFIDSEANNVTVGVNNDLSEATVPVRVGTGTGHKVLNYHAIATGAGTTSSDATQLNGSTLHAVTGAAGTGVKLPTGLSYPITVVNADSTDAILVYPPTGGQIDNLAVDAGYSVAAGSSRTFRNTTTTQTYSY